MSEFTRAAALIAPAIADTRPLWTLDGLRRDYEAGVAKLWTSDRSAILFSFTDYLDTGERVIEVGPAGGDLAEIMAHLSWFEAEARRVGATQAHITGRRGWARQLRELGYEEWATIVRKIL